MHTYIALHYIRVHYITVHYITLHYITLHYITLHYITFTCHFIYTTYMYVYMYIKTIGVHAGIFLYVHHICICIYIYMHVYTSSYTYDPYKCRYVSTYFCLQTPGVCQTPRHLAPQPECSLTLTARMATNISWGWRHMYHMMRWV